MAFSEKQNDALSAPLSRDQVKTRKKGGQQLSYIEGWVVIKEANRIFGFDGWHRETVMLQETNRDLVHISGDRGDYDQWRIGYIAKVRVTVGTVVREGTGYGSGMGKPEAIGDAVEGAIKEAETDAMKRCFMTFGNPFGLALYDKEQNEVEDAPSKPMPEYAKKLSAQAGPIKLKQTAKEWGNGFLNEIRALPLDMLDSALVKNSAALVKLHITEPVLHKDIIALVQQRQSLGK
jgi:DNA repair and recombination protein RAD52